MPASPGLFQSPPKTLLGADDPGHPRFLFVRDVMPQFTCRICPQVNRGFPEKSRPGKTVSVSAEALRPN